MADGIFPSANSINENNQSTFTTDSSSDNDDSSDTSTYKDDVNRYYKSKTVTSVTKNKELSYFGNGVQVAGRNSINGIIDRIQNEVVGIANNSKGYPPGYYDYINYEHRKQAFKFVNEDNIEDGLDNLFRIGDCVFVIPPDFISVTTASTGDSIQGIRHGSSLHRRHGYSRKEIQVSLVLNGMEQINGYEVDSPFAYKYYVDGLRTLISQFRYTPFTTVENVLLNTVHGIHTVSLRNITVGTVEGFPETLNVTISMQEFNAKAYIHEDEVVLDDIIDWDLYRYYIQRPLQKGHKRYLPKVKSNNLTGDFKFKLLNQDALNGANVDSNGNSFINKNITIDITNDSYYSDFINSDDNLHLCNMNFSIGNIMPIIQMSDHESPTSQYLGATDIVYSFTFETTDSLVVSKFEDMNKRNLSLIRNNREKSGIGFIKIENEIINLSGTSFLLINELNSSTVPGFPGLYSINMECISYDSNQKENEKLTILKPFRGTSNGTKDDLISQKTKGITNKIRQDAIIEEKLLELELYPDLDLPTYDDVNKAIYKIRDFRQKNQLTQMSISKLSELKMETTGQIIDTTYSKYVDPDFYIMYSSKLSDLKMSSEKQAGSGSSSQMNESVYINKISKYADAIASGNDDVGKSLLDKLKGTNGNLLDLFNFKQPTPDIAVEPQYAYGYEPDVRSVINTSFLNGDESSEDEKHFTNISGGSINNPSSDPTMVKKIYGNPFVDLACDRADAKCGYVYGSDGQIYTEEMKKNLENTYPYSYYNGGDGETSQWLGKQVFDCSGLICWAMRKIGLQGSGFRVSSSHFGSYGTKISASEATVGDVFYDGEHCGIVLDNDRTVEAVWSNIGVSYRTVNKSRYNFVRLTGLEEANKKFLENNKNFYSTSNTGSSGSGGGGCLTQEVYSVDNKSTTYTPTMVIEDIGGASNGTGKNLCVLGDFGNNSACDKWNKEILKVAKEFNYDPNMIKTFMQIESSGDPNAVSYSDSNVVGLMQVALYYHKDKFKGTNYFDPEDNIRAGCGVILEYGGQEWVKYDLEKTICNYNAGPDHAKDVYYYNEPMYQETVDYINKYKNVYKKLIDNGGNPGDRITLGDGSQYAGPTITTNTLGYFNDSDFENPNYGSNHGADIYDIDLSLFGKSALSFISSATATGNQYFSFKGKDVGEKIKKLSNKNVIEYMFHDMVQYSSKGRLNRAFPSFIFIIADEQSDWIDDEKLWTNYYVYRSVLDISIHQAYDNPISTAKVSLTNFNNNLSKIRSVTTIRETLDDDYIKAFYDLTGSIINEKITDKMIKIKNDVKDEIYLYEGARVHIRLGYGSNPSKYPTCFNGTITNVQYGDTITIVAQSDGVELVSQPLTNKTNQTNKDLGLPEEVSNMIAKMFVARENDFINALTFGEFKIKSKHGIEHFGIYFNGNDVIVDEELSLLDESQFDIVQNIYKGTYKGVPFSSLGFLGFDGESNWRFYASGKNVWDVLKMCEKSMPEFVAYPRNFGFESRIFYGLPSWLCNYKYEVDSKTGDLYVRSKSFAQIHEACSFDSIIDNNIKIDTRNLVTNYIGIYTLGGDLATTPAIMSDKHIDWSRQKTRTIDTTSVQDLSCIPSFIDKILEWTGLFDNGKELAIRICLSELITSWKETYTGSLLILGQPEINTHDWVFINDTAIRMNGMVTVREVIHSMSVSTGFTTSIIPGMMTFNTMKQSGLINLGRSAAYVTNIFITYKFASFLSRTTMSLVSKAYSASKIAQYTYGLVGKVVSFTATKGKDVYNLIKTGDSIVDISKFILKVDTLVDAIKTKRLFQTVSGAYNAVKASCTVTPQGWVALACMVVIDILVGWLITALVDMFAYRYCIIINPLFIIMPDGTPKAFAGNIKGAKKLLPISVGSTEEG